MDYFSYMALQSLRQEQHQISRIPHEFRIVLLDTLYRDHPAQTPSMLARGVRFFHALKLSLKNLRRRMHERHASRFTTGGVQ